MSMPNRKPTIIYARVKERLEALGMTERQASLAATEGRDPNFLGMIRRGVIANPRIDRMQHLAAALKTDLSFLTGGTIDQSSISDAVPIVFFGIPLFGKVEAGRYYLVDDLAAESEPVMIPASRHPRFPNAPHLAYEVVGDCMNALEPKPILPGEIVICVEWAATGYTPISDMVVVVEHTRDGGHMREITLKQIEVRGDGIALCPRSTNKAHREIWLPKDHEDDGRTVTIVGLVYTKQSDFEMRF
jgi:transcriptional regulator with XRE-family HTH domain